MNRAAILCAAVTVLAVVSAVRTSQAQKRAFDHLVEVHRQACADVIAAEEAKRQAVKRTHELRLRIEASLQAADAKDVYRVYEVGHVEEQGGAQTKYFLATQDFLGFDGLTTWVRAEPKGPGGGGDGGSGGGGAPDITCQEICDAVTEMEREHGLECTCRIFGDSMKGKGCAIEFHCKPIVQQP